MRWFVLSACVNMMLCVCAAVRLLIILFFCNNICVIRHVAVLSVVVFVALCFCECLCPSVDFGVLLIWRDRRRTSWIREQAVVEDILATIKTKDLSIQINGMATQEL